MALDDQLAILHQRMLQQLPANLEEVRAQVEAVCGVQPDHRAGALSALEMSAHRLRGRAAMLHLEELSSAAAQLEFCAQAGRGDLQLRSILAACLAAPTSGGALILD